MGDRAAHVLGGGLAGLAAAWEFGKAGWDVVVYEAADTLGGKAGSIDQGAYWSDHGYHLFPDWYHNVRRLMGEAGLDFEQIRFAGERFTGAVWDVPLEEVAPAASDPEVARPSRVADAAAFLITLPGLIAADDHRLAGSTIVDYLGRFPPWIHRRAMTKYHSMVLKALSGDAAETSALSVAHMFRLWAVPLRTLAAPAWSALNTSLQMAFIDRLGDALRTLDVECRLGANVQAIEIADRLVTNLTVNGERQEVRRDDVVVCALPPDVAGALLDREDLRKIGEMMEPMSAADVFYESDPGFPRTHFGLVDMGAETPPLNLTGYEISEVWSVDDLPGSWPLDGTEAGTIGSVVQLVIARTGWLRDLPDPVDTRRSRIEDEMALHLLDAGAPLGMVVHPNLDAPLVQNRCDLHLHRPPDQRIGRNLWLAGDYMETSIDVASMEAAVASGRMAGRDATGCEADDTVIDVPRGWSVAAAACLGVAWSPAAVVVGCLLKVIHAVRARAE